MPNGPEVQFDKNADKAYAVVGETLTYTITLKNLSSYKLNNVIIYDLLNEALQFVKGSMRVDNIPLETENILAGVHIGNLATNQQKEIIFKANILDTSKMIIENKAIAHFNIQLLGGSIVEIQRESNAYPTQLCNARLELIKTANQEEVILGDVLTYKVKLVNTGDLVAYSVFFKDFLPKQMDLISGSFKKDGIQVNGVDLATGITVGDIGVGKALELEYQVKILGSNCSGILNNNAEARFGYTLPDGTIGTLMAIGNPNQVDTQVAIATFKQMSIESYLVIPEAKPNIETINTVTGTAQVTNCHVIETPQLINIEGQNLTGYKLIMRGALNVVIEYTALDIAQTVHSAHYTIPFSAFIILPHDYVIGSKLEVTGLVEDMYYTVIDIRNFFVNTTVLMNVKILSC